MSSAIRLSKLISMRSAWHEFVDAVEQKSLYDILLEGGISKEQLGYLNLLEESIGQTAFRELCPLVLHLDRDRPIESGLFTAQDEMDAFVDQYVFMFDLQTRYNALQCEHALRLWPQNLESWFVDVMCLILQKVLAVAPKSLWKVYCAYLDARYGLSDGVAIQDNEKILSVVREEVSIRRLSIDRIKLIGFCIKDALQDASVQLIVRHISSHFCCGDEDTLKRLEVGVRKRCALVKDALTPNTPLGSVMDVRAANTFVEHGIHTLGDFGNWTIEEIRAIQNVGQVTIKEIVRLCSEAGVEMREASLLEGDDDEDDLLKP